MIYSGKFKVTSPFGQRTLNGKPDDHPGIDVVGITDKHVCAVVGGRVVSAMERYNDNDFRSNITNGGSMRKIEIGEDIKTAAIKACEAIGLDFAGVDILFGNDGPIVCEVNSNPHFKSSLECTGVDMSEEILDYIVEKLR
jgi:ribosomal protein S6--L-glutamate ligase/gamma-F420-2:alpha-L-glutamate ligase